MHRSANRMSSLPKLALSTPHQCSCDCSMYFLRKISLSRQVYSSSINAVHLGRPSDERSVPAKSLLP